MGAEPRVLFKTTCRNGSITINEAGIICKGPFFWSKVYWQVRREDVMSIEAGENELFGAACELIVHTRFGLFKAKMVPSRHIGPIRQVLGLSF